MPRRGQKVRHRGRERAGSARERADQAVAGEGARAVAIGDALRQHGVLERHQHAEIAGRRIDRAEESDEQDERDVLEAGKSEPGRDHQAGAGDQQRAQVVTRAKKPTASVSSAEPSSAAVATSPIWNGV